MSTFTVHYLRDPNLWVVVRDGERWDVDHSKVVCTWRGEAVGFEEATSKAKANAKLLGFSIS
jgi:hypothetical protein